MNKSIVKVIVVGILFGAIAFFAPFFLIKALLFIFVAGILFKLFFGGRRRRHWFEFTDRIRKMSDEEYSTFRNQKGRCLPDKATANK